MDDRDLAVLGYGKFLAGLEAGVAAHHAGMVPPFKEAVEACFVEGLVKVVFATETLALGINMPARSVVIEKLSKFTGEHHQFLTPGEYTQLTGRGRRASTPGDAMVPGVLRPIDQVAALATSRCPAHLGVPPSGNMAANLVFAPRPSRRTICRTCRPPNTKPTVRSSARDVPERRQAQLPSFGACRPVLWRYHHYRRIQQSERRRHRRVRS
jgi:hypothetical protein